MPNIRVANDGPMSASLRSRVGHVSVMLNVARSTALAHRHSIHFGITRKSSGMGLAPRPNNGAWRRRHDHVRFDARRAQRILQAGPGGYSTPAVIPSLRVWHCLCMVDVTAIVTQPDLRP
ncbi:hypothetical protein PUN4_150083 [Paraburkholderia unamae]|nr:hypothetical protein PUN4_150083 [Paraburkholderia unamae]